MTGPSSSLTLPCSYRTCKRPAVSIATARGEYGMYAAGACRQHEERIGERARKRAGLESIELVQWQPVRETPPPPEPEQGTLPL